MASTAIQTRTVCEGAPGTAAPSPELTVLIPVLNERDNLAALLPRLARVLATLGCASEVLVVDGGSRDGTAEVARGLGA
ncbi:MAG TPA: glycosyltransferase, partial [Candidatus Acidoferrales bacterium]|nr:glycosyltransferase [Candidatus Acidoferrales bacterium]